jgi:hypothetical protein
MNRKVQIYIQTDKIDENFCSCIVITLDDVPYQAGSISSTEEGYNIYEFYIGEYHYFIVYELANGPAGLDDNAWVLYRDAIGDRVEGYTFDVGTNCPVSDNWISEIRTSILTESCTVNKQYFERLDLFDDEKIVINSSVQNVSDISSVFSDYSQSFVVPASTNNNQILEHWYNSDVNALQDNRIRRKARIEIDHIPFKTGNLQLEKANIKNKRIESYTLQFFGDLVSLKDTLGEASLNTLDLSEYSFEYNLSNVSDLVSLDFDSAIKFPLITSKNLWSYGDGGTYDINDPAKAFYFTELFPAIKVKDLFNTIENQFNLTFTSDFLSNDRFTNLFLWLKNQEIGLNGTIPTINSQFGRQLVSFDSITNGVVFDITNSVAYMQYFNYYDSVILTFNVSGTTNTDNYKIYVYKDDVLINTIETSGDGEKYHTDLFATTFGNYNDSINSKYKFYVSSVTTISFDIDIRFRYTSGLNEYFFDAYKHIDLTSSTLDFGKYLPDIKITDFISGILKQFNLTCVPTSDTNYIIEPLDAWYSDGTIYDITEYTDTESIDIERVSLFKAIRFTHQQSDSFINRQFFALNNYEYGDLRDTKDFDGGDYNIELPFENLLFSKLNYTIPTNVQVGYCLNQEYNDYVPKPILLYKYTWQDTDVDINITDGTSTFNLTSYQPFGQDVRYGSQDISLNWSTDNSSLLEKQMDFNSYSLYYQSYLLNLYNKKNRITTIKTNLPLSILTRLKLNDRLVIRDKRYIINDYQADLTSGDVQFKLLNDFRFIDTLNWQNDPEEYPNIAG